MLCEHIHFSDEVLSIVNKEATSLNISECIGVYIRGTDYVKLKPSGEYVQPSVDQMKCKIHEFENKYNAPIFLVTEDGDIFDNLKKEFGDIIRIVSFDTFIRNYEGKEKPLALYYLDNVSYSLSCYKKIKKILKENEL